MSCAVCGRDQRGFGLMQPQGQAMLGACSMLCLDILHLKGVRVFKLTHYEKEGLSAASDAAGAYLEEIGKTDLATMTKEEWDHLLSLIFVKTAAEIQRMTDEGAVPF